MGEVDIVSLLTQGGASAAGAWAVIKMELMHHAEKIKDNKAETARAHDRIDDLMTAGVKKHG